MKITKMLLMAGAVIALSSCGGGTEAVDEMENPVESTLSVDTDNSSISWKGMKSADDFHTGTIKFKDGSAMFIDGNLVSGTYNVDGSSIAVTDEGMPEPKKEMLIDHLSDVKYFNFKKSANVAVSHGPDMGGNLDLTLTVLGTEISQTVPVTISHEDGKGSITGSFEIDFADMKATGFNPNPDQPDDKPVSSKIQFDLNLMLK